MELVVVKIACIVGSTLEERKHAEPCGDIAYSKKFLVIDNISSRHYNESMTQIIASY